MTTPLHGTGDRLAPPVPVTPLFPVPDGLPLRVRGITEGELRELARLDEEVFEEHAYPYFVLRQFYDLYGDHLLVVDDGGRFHGYVLAGTDPDRGRSWILGLGIEEEWRGNGLGRVLMSECLHQLREEHVREVRLTVEPANSAAIELYLSLGFTRVDRRENYFGPGADRLLMVLPLPG